MATTSGRTTWDWLDEDAPKATIESSWPGLESTGARWRRSRGGRARVCVMDSGIAEDHPQVGRLEGSFAVVVDAAGAPRVVPEAPGDEYGHGTACASIIRRIAPECAISSLRVVGAGPVENGEALVHGLRWAVRQRYDVVNLSLSTRHERLAGPLRAAADEAYFNGVVVVAAAHNSAVQSYPWRFASVISVGSHRVGDDDVFYYNPSPPVEFLARGRGVRAADLAGGEREWSGNSFAAPQISGRCALIKSAHPDYNPVQVKCALMLGADNVSCGEGHG